MIVKNINSVSLGTTNISISKIGLGTWAWGDTTVWSYGKGYTDDDIQEAFTVSINNGVNFLDTAEIYGRGTSEKLIGNLLKAINTDIVIASKFMPFPWRLTKGSLRKALIRSLKRLQLESVDVYQTHWPFPPVPVRTWMDAMADVVEDGLVRAVGVSNYSNAQMLRAYDQLAKRNIPLASNQVEYSLLKRSPETSGLLNSCKELGITLIAYSPLTMGLLTGKYSPDNPPPGIRGRRYRGNKLVRIEKLNGLLREIGQTRGGKSPAQVALNWLLAKGTVPIPGAKNAEQAKQNAGALGWILSDEEVALLDWESQK